MKITEFQLNFFLTPFLYRLSRFKSLEKDFILQKIPIIKKTTEAITKFDINLLFSNL